MFCDQMLVVYFRTKIPKFMTKYINCFISLECNIEWLLLQTQYLPSRDKYIYIFVDFGIKYNNHFWYRR